MEIEKKRNSISGKIILRVSVSNDYKDINKEDLERLKESFYKKWRYNLLSGKYKQGDGTLCEKNGESKYCCLGVIGKVYGYTDDILAASGYLMPLSDRLVRLPNGITDSKINHFFGSLNDTLKLSFEEIAEVISFIIKSELYGEE